MAEKPEMTVEQHARIESLLNEHGGLTVHPPDENLIVKVEFAGRTLLLNEDGDETIAPIETIPFRLSTEMVKRLLGADAVDDVIVGQAESTYPDYAVGRTLQTAVEQRIGELLGSSERADDAFEAAAIAADEAGEVA